MVLVDSHRVPRVPWYLGNGSRKSHRFRLQGCYPLWLNFPEHSTNDVICNFPTPVRRGPSRSRDTGRATLARLTHARFRLFPVRSPLLRESRLLSLPRVTEMVHFARLAPHLLCIQRWVVRRDPNQVAPFGNPRVKACLRLTGAYRSLPRPSSPSCT